jgi:hypothetical protein
MTTGGALCGTLRASNNPNMECILDTRPLLMLISSGQHAPIDLVALLEKRIPEVRVQKVTCGADALAACDDRTPVMALIDNEVEGVDGAELAAALAAELSSSQIVLLTRGPAFPPAEFLESHPRIMVFVRPLWASGALRLLRAILALDPPERRRGHGGDAVPREERSAPVAPGLAKEHILRLRDGLRETCLAIRCNSHDSSRVSAITEDPFDCLVEQGFALMPLLFESCSALAGREIVAG